MSFPAKTDREAILRTALEIVDTQGWPALSMRELGRRLGLRASSLYHHFPDRNSIEGALAAKASNSLFLWLKTSCANRVGKEKMEALANAYISFAASNQALYRLIAASADSTEGQALRNLFQDAISEFTKDKHDSAAALALWAFLHGYASLEATTLDKARAGLDVGLSALLIGLSKKQNIL